MAGLPAALPAGVVAASKTGELPGLRADMALMERDERWVAVAVVADRLADPERSRAAPTGARRCCRCSRRSVGSPPNG